MSRPFTLLVKPACGDCNLRCNYCFYLKKRALYPSARNHRMTDTILQRLVGTYMATEQPNYSFGWQGGEPALMGIDFFRRVTELQQELGRNGALVSNGLQTNATLIDDEFAAHLAKYRFLTGVSLDGPAEIHDMYRRYARGGGSHADVMRGISALRRQGADFNVLTLVSRANAGRPVETYRYLRDGGFMFHQYIECVEYDSDGTLLPYAVGGDEWGDFLCAVYDEWIANDAGSVSVRLFDSIIAMMVDKTPNVCSMGRDCRQYFVVEHNGDVYPCDFFVEPELRLGNIMTGTWREFADSAVYERFGKRKAAWNDECRVCEYLAYCAGDCPKNRAPGARDPSKLSALCAGWKRFYRHSLPGFKRLAEDVVRRRRRASAPETAFRNAGRNDPCPCGSGLKYKKCCGAVETAGMAAECGRTRNVK